jgi:hypothetical protein
LFAGFVGNIVRYPSTVFILGAGASRHTGAPLMTDFLSTAMNIMDRLEGTDDDLYRIFDKVFVYIAKNDALESLLKCDFRNIEDVFGLLDLETRVLPSSQQTRDALLRVILETLARTIKPEKTAKFRIACDNQTDVADVTSTPLGVLASLAADRPNQVPENQQCRNTIISLNYDTLAEQAMVNTGALQPDYGTPELSPSFALHQRARIRLLKLHGSSNWRTCAICKTIEALPYLADVSESLACSCGQQMLPMLVPPSWDKGIHARSLKRIWEEAFNYLKIARHWVFIGTSLPQTDQYLKYLFAVSLRHNVYLRQVTIVDPGDGLNIHRLFEQSASRVRVEHLQEDMVSALGGQDTPSRLFKKLRCFAPHTDYAFDW